MTTVGAAIDFAGDILMEAGRGWVMLWEFATVAKVYPKDPLILDLDGDGFNILTKENGVNFDLDGNGTSEAYKGGNYGKVLLNGIEKFERKIHYKFTWKTSNELNKLNEFCAA